MKIVRASILTFLMLSVGNSYAQFKLFKDRGTYSEGFIVMNNNDKIFCQIQDVSRASSCTRVYTKDIKTGKKTGYGPLEIKYYKRGSEEYHSFKRQTSTMGVVSAFMKPIIKGKVSLFAYYYTKGTAFSSYGTYDEGERYYLSRDGRTGFSPDRLEFKRKVGKFFQDYPALSERIKNKELRLGNLQEIVRLYNNWDRSGRPIEKKDGDLNKETSSNKSKVKLGFDVPLFLLRTYVNIPLRLEEIIPHHSGGYTYDVGAGLKIYANDYVNLKLGVHTWKRIYNVDYLAYTTDTSGTEIPITVKERGAYDFVGLYFHLHYNVKNVFLGAGVDVSISEEYSYDYEVFDEDEILLFSGTNQSESAIFPDFNSQVDLVLMAGLRFKLGQNSVIKPTISAALPLRPIIKTGYYTVVDDGGRKDLNINLIALKFGIIFEFGF